MVIIIVFSQFQPSQSKGDWLDAVIVAVNHFKNHCAVNIENKKIVLMTNFKVPTATELNEVQVVSIHSLGLEILTNFQHQRENKFCRK